MKIEIGLLISAVICILVLVLTVNFWRENKKMLFSRKVKARIIKCEICSYVYFVSSKISYSRCPVCSSINKIR